ncbi:MAG: type 4a pilus biogenesis protein PilO [Desulfobacteraceae bacterium]|jgi:type IV pilus assembly protein PilO
MDTVELSSPSKMEAFFESIENLSKVQRILISVGVFVLIIGAFVYLLYMPKFNDIDKLSTKLKNLEKKLASAKRNAASLKKFQAKMKEAEAQFKAAMRALPEKGEIPSLLTHISKSGHDVGLEFLLFEPKPEIRKEFYAEIPVAINVKGGYHDMAMFFDRVARLSRIVNVKNITMGREKEGEDLNTVCTAVTYKFVEPPPKAKAKAKTKKKK